MARTAGIVFSALVIFTAGLITFLIGAFTMWLWISVAYASRTDSGPELFGSFGIPAAVVLIGLGGWGVTSGVGIVKMEEWARISMLAFGVIFVVIAAFGALQMLRDPRAGVTYMEGYYLGSIRPEMMAFYGVLAALGASWLYFFGRKSMKAQFSS